QVFDRKRVRAACLRFEQEPAECWNRRRRPFEAFTIGSTYLFRANIVNAFRLSANRFAGGKTQPDFKDCNCGPAALGIKMFGYEPLTFALTVTGGCSIASANGPSRMATFAASDDLSIV